MVSDWLDIGFNTARENFCSLKDTVDQDKLRQTSANWSSSPLNRYKSGTLTQQDCLRVLLKGYLSLTKVIYKETTTELW